MPSCLRGNDKVKREAELPESAFARKVLANLGPSCVYIQKKDKKFLETDLLEE